MFNQGVRNGDFAPMLEQFTEDAELVFGRAGRAVSRESGDRGGVRIEPADDEVDVLSSEPDDGTIVARYAWRADDGRPAGRMIFTTRGEQIARLVVTFEPS